MSRDDDKHESTLTARILLYFGLAATKAKVIHTNIYLVFRETMSSTQ